MTAQPPNSTPPGWYADPRDNRMVRWWDGTQWTDHQQPAQQPAQPNQPAQQVHSPGFAQGYGDQTFGGHATGQVGGTVSDGSRNVFTEGVIIVSQKRKLIELTNEYFVYGQDGAQIGAVAEIGQSTARKALRFVSNLDQFLTHRLEVRDTTGHPLLVLTRPGKVFKSTVIVSAPNGSEIGRLVQQNVFGKIRFGLQAGGKDVGTLNAENWRAWNFALLDAQGAEVGRITKTWEGLLTTMFTTADNYVVHIRPDLPDPLRSLAVAAALTVDTALKQDSN
ncbi:phospholipid scramblase-related protein [Flexivirga caeni]|uniref:DUF2510 domain-containing protein n=1 Tax=Flexivirga caeni TaxID=2294115 RepID=A0A3M9M6D9_9MICO|nr:phospholipid scramblase-related protein [Flexivirga caeni]RNI21139.1 DUF2510 domain-containing protein [Flexivirga caeni]